MPGKGLKSQERGLYVPGRGPEDQQRSLEGPRMGVDCGGSEEGLEGQWKGHGGPGKGLNATEEVWKDR